MSAQLTPISSALQLWSPYGGVMVLAANAATTSESSTDSREDGPLGRVGQAMGGYGVDKLTET